MVIDNKIYFGYGSILVGSCVIQGLTLTAIKPPQPIGPLKTKEGIEFGQVITCNDLDQLFALVREIKKADSDEDTEISFGEYTVVLIAGSAQSKEILRKAADRVISFLMLPMAC